MKVTIHFQRGLYLYTAALLVGSAVGIQNLNHIPHIYAASTTQSTTTQKVRYVDSDTHKVLDTQTLTLTNGSLSDAELKLPSGYKRTDSFKYNSTPDQQDLHYDGDYWNVYVSKDKNDQVSGNKASTITMTTTTTENGKTTTTTTTTTTNGGNTGQSSDSSNGQTVDNNGKTTNSDERSNTSSSESEASSSENSQSSAESTSNSSSSTSSQTAEEKNNSDKQSTQTSSTNSSSQAPATGQTAEEKNNNDKQSQGNGNASSTTGSAQSSSQPVASSSSSNQGQGNNDQGSLPQTGSATGYVGLGLGSLATAGYAFLRRKLNL